jgi:hypothetical protein
LRARKLYVARSFQSREDGMIEDPEDVGSENAAGDSACEFACASIDGLIDGYFSAAASACLILPTAGTINGACNNT